MDYSPDALVSDAKAIEKASPELRETYQREERHIRRCLRTLGPRLVRRAQTRGVGCFASHRSGSRGGVEEMT